MKTWFVTRHPGAREWAEKRKMAVDDFITHLDKSVLSRGDTVIGTLPINIAAEIQDMGIKYIHLSLNVPVQWRGMELTAAQLEEIGASLVEYKVTRAKPPTLPGKKVGKLSSHAERPDERNNVNMKNGNTRM